MCYVLVYYIQSAKGEDHSHATQLLHHVCVAPGTTVCLVSWQPVQTQVTRLNKLLESDPGTASTPLEGLVPLCQPHQTLGATDTPIVGVHDQS